MTKLNLPPTLDTMKEEDSMNIIEPADMWRSGDNVMMRLKNGEEYMFNIMDIIRLKDLA